MGALRLLLASQSPRRRDLVSLLGIPFDVTTSEVPELPAPAEPPAALVARLSQAKASDAAAKLAETPAVDHIIVVLGCDTVVSLDGHVLGKPSDAVEAVHTLQELRGRPHVVYTALTLLHPGTGSPLTDVAATTVHMRDYADDEVAAYVAEGNPLDKAGAYAIQHPTFRPAAGWDGCYANVVGLPLCHVARCLGEWGHRLSVDLPAVCQAHLGQPCEVFGDVLAGRHQVMQQ